MIDLRVPRDRQLLLQDQSGPSVRIDEIFAIKPQLQSEQITDLKFKSSIHFTETRIIHLAGQSKDDVKEYNLRGK